MGFVTLTANSNPVPPSKPDCRITKSMRERLLADAKELLKDFDIPWERYSRGKIEWGYHGVHVDITWTHKKTKAVIRLTTVYFDYSTGEILQAGENYGELVS
jgi:hypothetical protein